MNLTTSKEYANVNILANASGEDSWAGNYTFYYNKTDDNTNMNSNVTAINNNINLNSSIFTPTNLAYVNETNEFAENQNMTNHNVTDLQCLVFDNGGRICSS